jgi:hypothetical protein
MLPLLMPLLLMLPQTPRILPNQHQHDWSKQEHPPPYTSRLGGKTRHGGSSATKRPETPMVPMVPMVPMLTAAARVEATTPPAG